MKPLKVKWNTGITLIEVLIVVSLIVLVISLGLFASMDDYRSSSFRDERNSFITTLMHARAQAVNNVCLSSPGNTCTDGKPHGVHIKQISGVVDAFIVFQGNTYNATDTTNEIFETENYISASGPTDVVFHALSANVSTEVTITLSGTGTGSSAVTIGKEGQIYWTN